MSFCIVYTPNISEKTGSANCMFPHVILRKKFSRSKVRMKIRLAAKFNYPAIRKTLVNSKIFKIFNSVSKQHFLVCKLCIGNVMVIKLYGWPQKMIFYYWCKFQGCIISRDEDLRGAIMPPPPQTFKSRKKLYQIGLNSNLIKKT